MGWSYVALGATVLMVCTVIMIATSGMWLIGSFAGVVAITISPSRGPVTTDVFDCGSVTGYLVDVPYGALATLPDAR